MFEDQEFVNAWSELETCQVDDWEFFTESHDVRIYRLYNDVRISDCLLMFYQSISQSINDVDRRRLI